MNVIVTRTVQPALVTEPSESQFDIWACDRWDTDQVGNLAIIREVENRGFVVIAAYPVHAWTRILETEDDYETVVG